MPPLASHNAPANDETDRLAISPRAGYIDHMTQNQIPFLKMHGAGNDFVILDARQHHIMMTPELAAAIGHRHMGVGFDQLAIISADDQADALLTFYNSDGSLSSTCGNATRCIATRLLSESGRDQISLRTERGLLPCRRKADGRAAVNMGQPMLDWADIPLAENIDSLHLPIPGDPAATGLGNPHMSFVVEDAEAVDLETLGAQFELHPLYPQKANVQFLHVIDQNRIRMRVWERGVGVTMASGSGATAAAVTAHRRGLTQRQVTVEVDGGEIDIDWQDDGVWISGPTQLVFEGVLSADFLGQV